MIENPTGLLGVSKMQQHCKLGKKKNDLPTGSQNFRMSHTAEKRLIHYDAALKAYRKLPRGTMVARPPQPVIIQAGAVRTNSGLLSDVIAEKSMWKLSDFALCPVNNEYSE